MDLKSGYKTTEFWAMIAANVLANFAPSAEAIGPKTAAVVTGVAYILGRAFVKRPTIAVTPPVTGQ